MSSYGNIEYFMELDYSDGWLLLVKAKEKEQDERAYQFYCSIFPYLDKDKRMTFEQFNKKPKTKKSTKTAEQILKQTEEINKKFGW